MGHVVTHTLIVIPPYDVTDINVIFWIALSNIMRVDLVVELTKYLREDREPYEETKQEREILNWWNVHSSKFPILATMTIYLLPITVSIVVSKSAFNTGGRVIDDYRSHLSEDG